MFILQLFLVCSQPNSKHVQHVPLGMKLDKQHAIACRAADYIAGDFTFTLPLKSNNYP